jgi:hypothetical protein
MATYFGYVEREADSYVNWADVGRNMSATIDNIQRVRDEKKTLIEKAYREDLDYIQSRPSGEHETLNAWSLNFGNTSAENLKLKYNMLKQGKISVNDFVTFRQNLSDSVEKIYTVNGQLQEAFKKVNDRTKAGENQELERATKVLLEKYGALENTLPYVNGLTGSVAIGLTEITKDAEGKEVRKLRQGDDAYLTPQQLQAAAMQEFNAYNEQADLDKWVEGTGEVVQDLREIGGERLAGLIISVTDVTSEAILEKAKNLPEGSKLSAAEMDQLEKYVKTFNEGETSYIDGILANPYNASALLTDRIKINPKTKQPYNIVFNKADQKTSNDLYVEKTPEGKFTPIFDETEIGRGQKDELRGFLKNQLRAKYDRKLEMKPYNEPVPPRPVYQQPNAEAQKSAAARQKIQTNVDKIRLLVEGSPEQKRDIFDWYRGQTGVDQKKSKYDTDSNQLIVYSSNPDKPEPVIYKFGSSTPIDDIVLKLAGVAFPDVQEDYGVIIKDIKDKKENPELDYDIEIGRTQTRIDNLQTRYMDLFNQGKGASVILELSRQIRREEKLLKEQKEQKERLSQGQGGGGGAGTPNLNATKKKKEKNE